ncbi:PIG-L family deacetylase [Christiangramia sp. OXR-203]|jgi:LmbE family N-acetylglucosaminyl deacetylase|uniref:PIG-L deacetylase family protein n=1 Tax=Christiangramia sp. OXR-203 TaxID=3100176 RepID=UPI002AC97F12|nr:PIG-L family deacetylase [Christiangramia sp. OXR-203]WPY99719.1 PIG-L family deacetylase [Christiangramia sp. OXR-203]
MLESLRNKRILVFVAHPDDELLGVGATMHKLIHEYDCKVRAVILGEGITSRSDSRDAAKWSDELKIHRDNIESARSAIGYESVGIYDFPDNRFDTVALLDIIKVVEKEKTAFQPEIVFTHHLGDVNIDHQRTFEAVLTAIRPLKEEKVHTLISFETPSGTEWRAPTDPKHFVPNMFIEVSKSNLEAKIKGMESYEFEKRKYPHPRSPEALKILAQRWGIVAGKEFAEAFSIVRLIN